SNHGGRQLDSAQASLRALEAVVAHLGEGPTVLMDGGVRRGTDIAKALCLGASAVLVGRPYLYGLAAGGQAGVSAVLEILNSELRRCMALMGVRSIGEFSRDMLRRVPV